MPQSLNSLLVLYRDYLRIAGANSPVILVWNDFLLRQLVDLELCNCDRLV